VLAFERERATGSCKSLSLRDLLSILPPGASTAPPLMYNVTFNPNGGGNSKAGKARRTEKRGEMGKGHMVQKICGRHDR
jgi:hypothetical protein